MNKFHRSTSFYIVCLCVMAVGLLWACLVAPAFAQTPTPTAGPVPVSPPFSSFTLPHTFKELLANAVSDALFLGALAAALTGLLFRFLEDYVPGNGYFLPEKWARLVSIVVPFAIAATALTFQELRGEAMSPVEDALLAAFNTALAATGGKSVTYTIWRFIKPSREDQVYEAKLAKAQVTYAEKKVAKK
jgi:hypothetical protein